MTVKQNDSLILGQQQAPLDTVDSDKHKIERALHSKEKKKKANQNTAYGKKIKKKEWKNLKIEEIERSEGRRGEDSEEVR